MRLLNLITINDDKTVTLQGFDELSTKCIIYLSVEGGIILKNYKPDSKVDQYNIVAEIDVVDNTKIIKDPYIYEIVKREKADMKMYQYMRGLNSYIPVIDKF